FIWGLFNQVMINPFVWGVPTDQEVLDRTLQKDIPHVLDYLETEIPADGFLFGALSIADVSIATFFRNAGFARYRVDAERWPRPAALVGRVPATEPFQKLVPFENAMMRTPPPQQRDALAAIGAPLTATTFATATPRRGLMKI